MACTHPTASSPSRCSAGQHAPADPPSPSSPREFIESPFYLPLGLIWRQDTHRLAHCPQATEIIKKKKKTHTSPCQTLKRRDGSIPQEHIDAIAVLKKAGGSACAPSTSGSQAEQRRGLDVKKLLLFYHFPPTPLSASLMGSAALFSRKISYLSPKAVCIPRKNVLLPFIVGN